MSEPKTCASCRFWDEWTPQSKKGFCRVNPPVRHEKGEDPEEGVWPATDDKDWCGAHLKKE